MKYLKTKNFCFFMLQTWYVQARTGEWTYQKYDYFTFSVDHDIGVMEPLQNLGLTHKSEFQYISFSQEIVILLESLKTKYHYI